MKIKAIPVLLKLGIFVMFTDKVTDRYICDTSGKVKLSLTLRVTQTTINILSDYNSNFQHSVLS
ncbi:MAG: hypothetical protein MK289_00365 [Trichodesmium sp. ALOHA_ZT_67]|nr:hypothetical protein [Trichodesmium sp. ALOHA_ZT_67]